MYRVTTQERPVLTTPPLVGQDPLRDVFADVLGQHFVDERLVAHASAARFLAELIEHAGVDTNRDQLAWFVTERRSADAPHRLQLLGRRLGDFREVNLSP